MATVYALAYRRRRGNSRSITPQPSWIFRTDRGTTKHDRNQRVIRGKDASDTASGMSNLGIRFETEMATQAKAWAQSAKQAWRSLRQFHHRSITIPRNHVSDHVRQGPAGEKALRSWPIGRHR